MSKQAFIQYIYARKKGFIRELNSELANLRRKRQALSNDLLEIENPTGMKTKLMIKFKLADSKESIQNELINIDRATIEIQKTLQSIAKGIEDTLSQIENMPEVNTIRYFTDGMQIITNDIIGGKKYNWGQYIISISDDVEIKRLDGLDFEGVVHPYIKKGVPCFGVWATDVNTAIHQGGLYTVAIASIQLLKCTTTEQGNVPYMNPSEFTRQLNRVTRQ